MQWAASGLPGAFNAQDLRQELRIQNLAGWKAFNLRGDQAGKMLRYFLVLSREWRNTNVASTIVKGPTPFKFWILFAFFFGGGGQIRNDKLEIWTLPDKSSLF